MKAGSLLFGLYLLSLVWALPVNVQFNLVFPIEDQVESIFIIVKANPESQEQSFPMVTSSTTYNVTHQYIFSFPAGISSVLQYRYIVYYKNATTIAENFWRELHNCRLHSSNSTTAVTVNEFFGQTETNLGVPPVPNVAGIPITPPQYFDDDQIVTASFYISQVDLDAVIFNPNDTGEVYVKANLTLVGLKSLDVFEKMKIRRAGGISLHKMPYSYQIKLPVNGPAGEDTVIKFKAYPLDYKDESAFIVAEKTCADICYSVGAPINFVSYSRVFINGIYQGLYGMVEKVDENFVQRRWPYVASGNSVGSLYKVHSSYTFILDQTGFHNGFDTFSATQSADNSTCCPCYENGCSVDDGCDIFDDNDQICPTLDCCSCSWEKNGKFDANNANCNVQKPFYDFITLGNAILNNSLPEIDAILDAESYARSLICSLAVMNHDGYAYSGYNYYWYRDPVSSQFKLILYDQDATLTNNRYTYSTWTPYDWTFVGDLTDAPFLPTILQLNSTLNAYYTNLFSNFLEDYYRPDQTGPLFDRMNIYSKFIQKYNPQRVNVLNPTDTFIKIFISPLSEKLYGQLPVPRNPVTVPPQPFCNSTSPF